MAKKDKIKVHSFNDRYHLVGRIWMLFSILLFFSVPITIGVYYEAMPDWSIFGSAGIITLIIINLGSCIGEPVLYAPMLGTNGEYLAFITGNLSNLKIPCVVRAHEIYDGLDRNQEEYELVSTISVATSSLVTILIIGVFVLVLALAQGAIDAIRSVEWITPAFTCVVYALFGSLGGKYVVKNPKFAIPPLCVIVVLSIILGVAGVNPGAVYLVIGIAICLLFAILQIVREKKKEKDADELTRLTKIANETEVGIVLNLDDEEEVKEETPAEEKVEESVEETKGESTEETKEETAEEPQEKVEE